MSDYSLEEPLNEISNLVDLLRHRARRQPEQKAYVFLKDGETEEGSRTYHDLDVLSRAIGARLQSLGATGKQALLMYPQGLEFIAAYFGCLYAGAVAVPAYPPHPNRPLSRLIALVSDCQAAFVLTTTSILAQMSERIEDVPGLKGMCWLATDDLHADLSGAWQEPPVRGETLAFLQYTSGSTGSPKGVMVTHSNLLWTIADLDRGWEHTPDSIMVAWLPTFHDLGLIYGVLLPLYRGFCCYLMDPMSFLQRPIRWLEAISRYRATHSFAPNFAFELCIGKSTPEQRAALDLSSWRMALNAAEPLRESTLRRFSESFKPSGFRYTAICPGYGLAEASVKVSALPTGGSPTLFRVESDALGRNRVVEAGPDSRDAQTLIGCGRSQIDAKILIVDPDFLTRCSPDQVGEIWVSSPSVAQGYWQRPAETKETFHAYLADTGEGPFLRTGDLGFLKDGELFITGRLKDLIIIRGRNHYPQDIELTAEKSHPSLRPGCGAAFSVEVEGEERLVLVQEVKGDSLEGTDLEELFGTIRRRISEEHELQVEALVLLRPRSIFKTSSGKIQRKQCRTAFLEGNLSAVAEWRRPSGSPIPAVCPEVGVSEQGLSPHGMKTSVEAIEAWLVDRLAKHLKSAPEHISVHEAFAGFGLDSKDAVGLSGELEDHLGRRLPQTLFYDYPTIRTLALYLAEAGQTVGAIRKASSCRRDEAQAMAIIGMGCRFPGAGDPEAFWHLLREGKDAIREVPPSRWDVNAFYDPRPGVPGKMSTRHGGFLEQTDLFDPQFFGISPREAESMDPQQRLLLEVTWEALEHAGQAPERLAGTLTGVFVGISTNDYARTQFDHPASVNIYSGTGTALSMAANRLSYFLDTRGPSWAVDTACSSSLVALHHACTSLRRRESDLALVGGVNLILSPELTIAFSQTRLMAADGRCKTFDAGADGYVRAEGCAVVVVKRLSDALADGDNILALIRGSAVNHNGRSNGITAPNGPSQEAVIRRALENAGVQPSRIIYVEAHGTGTALGDPIEFHALKNVLTEGRCAEKPCWVGSVKTNIGHLEAAAGLAGLIKVVLSLKHGQIPPNLHLKEINPRIALKESPMKIPLALQQWPKREGPRLAGVSSFGFGGTNAHVVLEEAPSGKKERSTEEGKEESPPQEDRPLHLFTLSAKTEKALKELAGRYENHLGSHPALSIGDVCFTAAAGRSHFDRRVAIAADSTAAIRRQLAVLVSGQRTGGVSSEQSSQGKTPKIAFLFTGQGSQYVGMGRQLYETQPTFRLAMDRCDEILAPCLKGSLLRILYPDEAQSKPMAGRLEETAYTQPALFALEYCLAALWESWGIRPSVVMGHSVGEYVAACVAGVFSLEDGLKLVAERGRLMQTLPWPGEMVALFCNEARVRTALEPHASDVSIAAVNGPEHIVISGRKEAARAVASRLRAEGVETIRLNVSHAFHSPLMAPMLEDFSRAAAQASYGPPRVGLISNVTGKLASAQIATPGYWTDHIRRPVRFMDSMETLHGLDCEVFLEVGPHPVLLGMARYCGPEKTDEHMGASSPKRGASGAASSRVETTGRRLASLRRGQPDWQQMLESLGALYVKGAPVDWRGFDQDYPRRFLPLPTYPFQRQRYWAGARSARHARKESGQGGHPLLGRPLSLAVPPSTRVWSQTLGAEETVFLEDHRIDGVAIFPAAGYAEMTLSASETLLGSGPLCLENVSFEKALDLSSGRDHELQTHLAPGGDGKWAFSVHSRPIHGERSQGWVRHAKGRVRSTSPESEASYSPSPDEIRTRCGLEIQGDAFYREWAARGNQWGPMFQGIDRLWVGHEEAIVRIRPPRSLVDRLGDYYVHPALLDACVQALAGTLSGKGTGAFVGRGVESLSLLAPVRGEVFWSHAVLRPGYDRSRQMMGDVRVTDADGRVLARIDGLEFEFLRMTLSDVQNPDRWLHALKWHPAEVRGHPVTPPRGTWVVLDDGGGVGKAAAQALRGRGCGALLLSPADAAQMERVLKGEEICGIVKLPTAVRQGSDVSSSDALQEAHRMLREVLSLVRMMAGATRGPMPRLWCVTRGAWTLEGERHESHPLQAAVWGLGRTLALEHTRIWGGLVDLDPTAEPGDSGALLADVLLGLGGEDQVAVRMGKPYTARLVRVRAPQVPGGIELRKDATYLITGGLGALGLHMARWLAELGARHLVLMGRSGLPDRSLWKGVDPSSRDGRRIRSVLALEALGAGVRLAILDVADERAFRNWITSFRTEQRPPIRGVVHAAGVLKSGPVLELDDDSLMANLRPKVGGAWVLDRCLQSESLDFFVLFSSASGTLSSPDLAAYAAANAFLDAMAGHRRARGLAALSIAWGAWGGPGLAAKWGTAGSTSGGAMGWISPEQGLDLAGRLWHWHEPHVAVLPVDWSVWRAKYPEAARLPLLTEIVGPFSDSTRVTGRVGSLERVPLLALEDAQRQSRLETWLSGQVAEVLLLSVEDMDPDQPLNTMGLDSLMALEIRNRVESALEVSISIVDLIRGPSIRQTATRLKEMLERGEKATEFPTASLLPGAEQPFPLSYGQRAQWLLHQLDPGSSAYHVAFAARIRSQMDAGALQRAFQRLIDRHATLRSTFTTTGGEVCQCIRNESEPWFHVVDANTWTEDVLREEALKAYHQPFDLIKGPVLRVHLFVRSERDRLLLLTIHHIACDGWSLWVLLEELRHLYTAEKTGSRAELTRLNLSYGDYIQWQAEMLAGPQGRQLRDYWKRQLEGAPTALNLPTDRPRPPVQTYRGTTYAFNLTADLSGKIKELAQDKGTTLFMTLLAAFQVLLYRYCGQEDLLVGSPFAGRNHSETARLVGYLVNPVVLRADFSGNPTFDDLLGQVRQTVLEAIAHQDYPFPLLVEQLQPERDLSRSPVFQVDFVLQRPQQSAEVIDLMALGGVEARIDWGGLELEPFGLSQQEGQFDLSLELAEGQGSFFGLFKYNTDLFDDATIGRMAGHYRTLLEGVAADPGKRVSELSLLGDEERHQLLVEWNGTRAETPGDRTICWLFEQQAAQNPHAPAVVFDGRQYTYRELNGRANQLAHRLRALGVGPEIRVGICLERCLEMVEGVLGVLKAGGAYVPLDPRYPRERLGFMLEDAGVRVLVTDSKWAGVLHGQGAAAWSSNEHDVVCLDRERGGLCAERQTNPVPVAAVENLAYVIYTSGSTGRPKGVMVTHRSLVSATRGWLEAYRLEDHVTTHLQMASFSFDVFSGDLFRALCSGAKLVLCPQEWLLIPEKLYGLMRDEGVDAAEFVPAVMRDLVSYLEESGQDLAFMRLVVVGSDAWSGKELERLRSLCGRRTRIINSYGVSEATIDSTFFEGTRADLAGNGAVPIGRPFANTQVYILDRHLHPVPVGVPGELHIGGEGLARGYLNRPDLTAEKFIPNPFTAEPGARLYKTGDLARYLPDGNVVFLGRMDHQVKIRGFRIELEEIENTLGGHPAVKEAVVMDQESRSGLKSLVAYVVPEAMGTLNTGDLHRFLKEKLPDFMVPSYITVLDALPVTPNGKIDRRALRFPEGLRPQLEQACVIPRTDAERRIAGAWREVLQLEDVGIDDNFFEVGGHSFLMARVHRKLQEVTGQQLTMVELFQYPTIRSLAVHLSTRGEAPLEARPSSGRASVRIARSASRRQQKQSRQRVKEGKHGKAVG